MWKEAVRESEKHGPRFQFWSDGAPLIDLYCWHEGHWEFTYRPLTADENNNWGEDEITVILQTDTDSYEAPYSLALIANGIDDDYRAVKKLGIKPEVARELIASIPVQLD